MDSQNEHQRFERLEELRSYFNTAYGLEKEWPKTFEVSPSIFAQACQASFRWHIEHNLYEMIPGVGYRLVVSVGKNGGIMFKNVELLLRNEYAQRR